ncbi:MAG: 50S rRNA methyltransferase [Verrucomicrobia bacterium]|nr:50S rRNA methyltransferase [Verrucomicrobiota bacterium]
MKQLFVTCPHGFEPILEKELKMLGVHSTSISFCGVFVPKSFDNACLINYWSRVATRVLWPIADFSCRGKEDLYTNTKNIPWSDFMHPNKTFAIDSNVSHHNLTNSLFASLVVKDAICDFFREKVGARPSIDKHFPDVQLNLFIQKGRATLYLDTSGAPLHKRGWRDPGTEATLHESLAAALLLLTGYSKEKTFCDPFCGSGTFLVEAAMIATNTPPGFLRKKWGFFHLPGFDKAHFLKWKEEQDKKRIPLEKGKIFGSDKSREAAESCQKHLGKLGFSSSIQVNYDDVAYYKPPFPPQSILTNPPYGKRLETSVLLFKQLAEFLENKCAPEVTTYLLYPEQELLETAGLFVREELSFKNGGLPIKLFNVKKNLT